ncbi:MAG TPA: HD domain-containing phosphohydrolase [Verrucomicrobiae bacterium]|nr:HD domain-containing phosphohydrolase [Verrucomicrobiae bacterium]
MGEKRTRAAIRATILAVDDEPRVLELVVEMLSSLGPFRVLSARTAPEAFEILSSEQIDILLSDLFLGSYSGLDILHEAKAANPDIVIIFMTAQPSVEGAVAVLKEGAYDYLVKPFRRDDLKAAIERGMEKQKLQRENIHLKEQLALYQISEAMVGSVRVDEVLGLILDFVLKEFKADTASILLLDPATRELKLSQFRGKTRDIEGSYFVLGNDPACRSVVESAKPKVVNKSSPTVDGSPRPRIRSMVSYPLLAKGQVIGVLNVVRTETVNYFSQGELFSLGIVASKAATAIDSARLYEELESAYFDTINVLANSIEARDRYTRRHTDRVRYLTEMLAVQLGFSGEKLKEVRMGGILHDVGKISVPDHVLNKPGPLTKEEFAIMKKHPETGKKMLEGIEFLRPALPYVLYHHEQYDGSGYPYGLKGEEIPFEGRLLAVADTFDAIISDRPYRKGAPFEKALDELVKFSGRQFDPSVVNAFVAVWENHVLDLEFLATGKYLDLPAEAPSARK